MSGEHFPLRFVSVYCFLVAIQGQIAGLCCGVTSAAGLHSNVCCITLDSVQGWDCYCFVLSLASSLDLHPSWNSGAIVLANIRAFS